jgi:hypothetical protein
MPQLVSEFGRSVPALKMMATKLGLRKSPIFERVEFQQGHRPWNAGKKGWQAGGKARLTQFKKGHRGKRQKEIGAEREGRDGVEIKIAEPNTWTSKARYVYQQKIGPIAEGSVVRFKDGNRRNFAPENLSLVTRAEHLRLNWRPRGPKRMQIPLWISPILSSGYR